VRLLPWADRAAEPPSGCWDLLHPFEGVMASRGRCGRRDPEEPPAQDRDPAIPSNGFGDPLTIRVTAESEHGIGIEATTSRELSPNPDGWLDAVG
jgi:hypothetical protein